MHLHLRFRRIVALVAGLLLTLSIHAQVITKSFRGVPLKTVLEEVEKQTGYSFLFESKEVDVDKPVTASFKNATIQTVLDKVLDGSLRYTINDKLVTISQRPRQGATVAKDGSVTLSGTVISSSDNQPIVGANAFAHEAGIHQHGVIANAQTYEIMKAADIGITKSTMVLGKHSGKHALRERLESMGYTIADSQLEEIFTRFKSLADKKKTITNSDLEALVLNRRRSDVGGWDLAGHVVNVGEGVPNTSCVKLVRGNEEREEVAIGSGPLDASFKAINRITGMDVNLESFSLNAVTDGEDAIGEAVVKISHNGDIYTGTGISTDIIESSIRAYLNGINKAAADHKEAHAS